MFNDEWVPDQTPDELRTKSSTSNALLDEMKAAGVFVYAEGGIDASTALFSVETKDGQALFTDGPFVETKEHLGGFTVIDVPDDETARDWAGRMALTLDWPQEGTASAPGSRRSSTDSGMGSARSPNISSEISQLIRTKTHHTRGQVGNPP